MKNQKTKRLLALSLSSLMLAGTLSACGGGASSGGSSQGGQPAGAKTEGQEKYPEFITIDMFNNQANYQGIQAGWYGEVIRQKFNMEINLISPNAAGGGDTLFQTRAAAGNLGDLITIGAENGRLEDMVKAELIMDITDKVQSSENLTPYMRGIREINNLVDEEKIYCIPSSMSQLPWNTPSEGIELTYGPYLRWDLYEQLGRPEIKTLESLLPVLKEMQDKQPESDTGKKTYAISLFKDWDGNMMCLAKQPACMYGYDEQGFLLVNADATKTQSILEDGGEYKRVLKWFYDANQLGILDPDSTTQNYDTLFQKYQDGAVLFSPWPWLGQAAYNTTEHKQEGKGFMIAPMQDMDIFSYGAAPGLKYVMAVGSKCKDPDRVMDFIDWLYSPEGISLACAQVSSTCGPEGVTWEFDDQNRPTLTEFGQKVFSGDTQALMPEEYGGGTYYDGISQLNYTAVLGIDINPQNNAPYNYALWETTLERNKTPLDVAWQEAMGAKTTLDYLEEHHMYSVAPGTTYIAPAASSDIDNLRNQIKQEIVSASWKMVFAKDEAEFEKTWADMKSLVEGLGYQQVLDFDLQVAKELQQARAEAKNG